MMKRNASFSSLTHDLEVSTQQDDQQDDQALLFEISWEVARKVGGIYTVMRSKAPVTVGEYGDSYALIGPMWPHTAALEFEEIEPSAITAQVLNHLHTNRGVVAKFGRWLVKGYPRVFLLDVTSSRSQLTQFRNDMMPGFAPLNDYEVDEALIFGYQVSWLLESFCAVLHDRRIIAHFHEWLVGVGLIAVTRAGLNISKIFTTHATLLGRYLSAGGCDLYHNISEFKPDSEAGNRGIYARHWIEKEAAHAATVFTTVSDITGLEAEYLLHKKPDIITPNGLETMRFTALHEFQNLHLKYKEVLNEFVLGHFSGSYNFDIDKTLYFFTAGRYELFNKGVDLYLEALARLNHRLKEANSQVTVVAFIIMPTSTSNYQVHSLTGQALMKDVHKSIDQVLKNIKESLLQSTARGLMPDLNSILSPEDLVNLKRRVLAVRQRPSPPPVVTHNMKNENDEILNYIRKVKLFNTAEDRVKIIFHPEFLTPTNPLIPLDYSDFVRGCHLGVFPSYYEPWGYTPAECTMMGVPSVTSDQSGFGSFMINNLGPENERESNGIFIINRRVQSPHDSIEQLTNIFYRFTLLDRRQRIELRNRTERLSPMLDWKNLGQYYIEARALAQERVYRS